MEKENVSRKEFEEIKEEFRLYKEQTEARLSLIESQIKTIQSALQEKAKEIVATNQISKIVPEPAKGEREYLEALLKDKIVESWRMNLQKVEKETLNGLVDLLADTVLKMHRWNKDNQKIADQDKKVFLESFVNQLVDSSFAGTTETNPKLMAIEAGVKALVITSKFVVAKYNEYKKTQELKDYWNSKITGIENNIVKSLRNESAFLFKSIAKFYDLHYQINFDRTDCSVKSLENEEDTPDFERSFDKITDYTHLTPKNSERSYELKQVLNLLEMSKNIHSLIQDEIKKRINKFSPDELQDLESMSNLEKLQLLNSKAKSIDTKYRYLQYLHCLINDMMNVSKEKFILTQYAKTDISEEDLQKLDQQFRLYRAIKETGEFRDYSYAGDHYAARRIAISGGLVPIFGIGLITGVAWGSQRGYYEYTWHNNIWKLKDMMRKTIYGFSSEVLEEILKKREILSHIKIFANATGSKYAQHFYEECLKDSYRGIENKQEFDQLYDLYYKLTNTGLANKENLYKYSFQLEQVDSLDSSPAYDFIMEAVKRNKSKFNNLPSSANDNTPSQTSSFVLTQIGNAAIKGLI